MKIEVDPAGTCTGCPFFEDEAYRCQVVEREFFYGDGGYDRRASWCPLDQGSVLVELRKPASKEES